SGRSAARRNGRRRPPCRPSPGRPPCDSRSRWFRGRSSLGPGNGARAQGRGGGSPAGGSTWLRSYGRRRVTALARRLEPRKILRPQRVLAGRDLVEVIPGVDAGFVPVVEARLDRIVADRLDRHDPDIALAHLEGLLAPAVATHLGRGRVNAQEFER